MLDRPTASTLSTALVAACLLAAGCGGSDDEGQSEFVPAAGENTPSAETPGLPPGALYDLDGNEWQDRTEDEQLEIAGDYISDNQSRCEGAEPDEVADYASVAWGLDFDRFTPAVEVLAEGCDGARQSADAASDGQ